MNQEKQEEKLKRIADFEWASVGQYLVYVSSAIGLAEINSQRVVSFPLARLGPETVLRQKKLTAKVLEDNIAALEGFVIARKTDLGREELVVLRGLYVQYKCNLETVRGHCKSAEFYRASVLVGIDVALDVSLFDVEEGGEDEYLF